MGSLTNENADYARHAKIMKGRYREFSKKGRAGLGGIKSL